MANLATRPHPGGRLCEPHSLAVRTVEWHLRKVFTKLEISSRMQLQRALPDSASAAPMA